MLCFRSLMCFTPFHCILFYVIFFFFPSAVWSLLQGVKCASLLRFLSPVFPFPRSVIFLLSSRLSRFLFWVCYVCSIRTVALVFPSFISSPRFLFFEVYVILMPYCFPFSSTVMFSALEPIDFFLFRLLFSIFLLPVFFFHVVYVISMPPDCLFSSSMSRLHSH